MPVYPQDCDKCEKKLRWEAFLRVFFSYGLTHNPNTDEDDTKWYILFYNEDLNKEEYVELKKIIDFYLNDLNCAQIARKRGVTRQLISLDRKRLLKKLKEEL